MNLSDELKSLAEQLADAPDDVAAQIAKAVQQYRDERFLALGMMAVRSLAEDPEPVKSVEVSPEHPQIVGARERLRDRLRGILDAWKRPAT